MIEEAFEKEVKVLVVGNGAVGKSSMIRRFCRGAFTDEYKKTIGVDFLERTTYVESMGEDVRLMVWDTAGQEEFDAMTKSYYRGAGAAALVFSTTDRASFEAISKWHRKVLDECGPIAMCICQNKIDLVDDEAAEVAPGEPEALAEALGVKLYRVCVREDFNVDRVFLHLARLWSRDPGLLADDAETGADATPSGSGTRARAGGFASTPGTERTMEEMATPAHATRDDGGGGGGGFGWQAAAVRSPAFSPGGGVHSGTPRRGAGAALAELLAERERAAAAEGVVRLGPSTRRTGGKKRLTARVTSKCAQGG